MVSFYGLKTFEPLSCFCAMELVNGETIEDRVRRKGPIDSVTALDITLCLFPAGPRYRQRICDATSGVG